MTASAEEKIACIFTADHHTGSSLGLCPPAVKLAEGEYHPGKIQRRIWGLWVEIWQEVRLATRGYKKVWFICGDAIDLDIKGRSHQYITGNSDVVIGAAVDVLEPGLSLVDEVYLIRGTDAHVGKNGEYELSLGRKIKAVKDPDSGLHAWWQWRGLVGEKRLDARHHVNMGARPWTEKNAANNLAVDTINRYILAGQRPPDLAVGAHVHMTADSWDNYPMTRAIILPCWQGITGYGHRLNSNRSPDIGMIALLLSGGKVETRKWIEPLAIGSVWTNTVLQKKKR